MKIHLCLALLCAAGLSFAGRTASFKIGDMEVFVLQDKDTSMPNTLFFGESQEKINTAVPAGKSPASMTAFVVRIWKQEKDKKEKTIAHTYLIDSGLSTEVLYGNLKAVGIGPDEIDVILLTHMHGDHIGGLLKDGKAAFPKATLCVAKDEYNHWLQANPAIRNIENAYQKHIELFAFGDLPGVNAALPGSEKAEGVFKALNAVGHTPGHTVFENENIIAIGDLAHSAALQFANPEICARYDMERPKAVQSRKTFFDHAAETKKVIIGAHLPFPCIGHVVKVEADHYKFVPLKK